MSLHRVVMLALVGSLVVLFAAQLFVERYVVAPQFEELERRAAFDDLTRIREALGREHDHLAVLCNDWATFDDSYEFMVSESETYRKANLTDTTLGAARIDVISYVRPDGSVLFSRANGPQGADLTQLDLECQAERFPAGGQRHHSFGDGFPRRRSAMVGGHILFIVAAPILPSSGEGEPRGTLVFGRFVCDEILGRLREQTRVPFEIYPPDTTALPEDDCVFLANPDGRFHVNPESSDRLCALTYLPDESGRPVAALHADLPRDITLSGRSASMFAAGFVIVTGLVVTGVLALLLHVRVVRPIASLSAVATRIGESGDLDLRVAMSRRDEIGALSAAFDRMVERLRTSRAQLVDRSRAAGMAEIASGVLHNIGNVLNTLNVSTRAMNERVRQSRLTGLARVASLVETHSESLPQFIETDPRGKSLAEYLPRIAGVLRDEHESLLSDLARVQTGLDYMHQVLDAQRTVATRVQCIEPVRVHEACEHAVMMLEATLTSHQIVVKRDYLPVPRIMVDRGKLMQILVNLLANAKEALDPRTGGRTIGVRTEAFGDHVRITISDNGMGIPAESLTRIFESGFTTKPRGRGFGLHYCAVSAREMGGRLDAESAGAGQGASFCLELPANVAEKVSV